MADTFSGSARHRNRDRYPYAHLLLSTNGELLVETVHGSLQSIEVEVAVSAARIRAGQPNRGGQVPGQIVVDGVPDNIRHRWIADERVRIDG